MFFRSAGARSREIIAWVVLQDCAKAVCIGTSPRSKSWSLGITRPSTSVVAGQATVSSGWTVPLPSAAEVVTVLKVDPGGNRPVIAGVPWSSAAPFWAAATIPPVEGEMATIAAGRCSASSARCAAP